MPKIYTTREWKGYGKQNYFWNEYHKKGNKIFKYKCNRRKFFDGHENNWETSKEKVESWLINSPLLPEWLKKFIK